MSLKKKYISLKLFSPFRRTVNHFPIRSTNLDQIKTQEAELEQCKDVIIKLKKQLSDKKNEIHLLKINKIILENEHYKTINNIKTFLKKSDPAYKEKYKTIEQNKNNIYYTDELYDKNQNFEDNSKEVSEFNENNIVITKQTLLNRRKNKMKIQNLLKVDSLKQHINSLNEELIKKNNLITELQNNKKVRGYKELQKSLKEKIRNYNQRFSLFKELSINKVKKLDQELSIAKEKERNLTIKIIGDEDKEKIENHHKNEEYNNMKQKISKYEIEEKKNSELIKKYKNENLNQKEEIKKLKNDNKNLENKNKTLIKENDEMKNKIKEMNKKINELENKIKKGEKIFFTDIEKDIKKSNKQNKKEKNNNIEENDFDDNYENE